MMEEKKEERIKFQLVEVPTQLGLAIKTPEGDHISTEQATVLLLNEVIELKNLIGRA